MRLSYSSTETYMSCPYKWYNHYLRKLRPKEENRSSLAFGSSVDFALNHLLETRNLQESLDKFIQSWNIHENNIDIIYTKSDLEEHLLIEDQMNLSTRDKSWISLQQKGLILVEEFNNQVMSDLSEVIKVQIDETINNELGDQLVIKTDFIGIYKGKRILFDNKTSSVKYDSNSVKKSHQLAIYYNALQEEYKLEAAGYIVLPKKINKRKLPKVNIEVIIDTIPEEMIQEAFDRFDYVLENVKAGNFPKNENSCINIYGKCTYYDYCKYGSTKGLVEKDVK